MAGRCLSIYQTARKEACLTQEQAAERLSVSVETVKAWEQGQRVPRPEDVERMQALYGTPWLGLEYTRDTCGRLGVLPELRLQGLPTAVLQLINRATALADDYRRLMLIAEDGVIDETETPEFQRISQSIQDVIAAGYEVLYAEAPPGAKKDPGRSPGLRYAVVISFVFYGLHIGNQRAHILHERSQPHNLSLIHISEPTRH